MFALLIPWGTEEASRLKPMFFFKDSVPTYIVIIWMKQRTCFYGNSVLIYGLGDPPSYALEKCIINQTTVGIRN